MIDIRKDLVGHRQVVLWWRDASDTVADTLVLRILSAAAPLEQCSEQKIAQFRPHD